MINSKVISGLTDKTPQSLLLDAGAFFKNFTVGTDTFETAVTAGKLLGATKGGGSFSAIPSFRPIEIDGIRGAVKDLQVLEAWEVKLGAKLVELTAQALVSALAVADKVAGTSGTPDLSTYEIIKGRNYVETTDYIDNITWVGTLSGSQTPVIIQVLNALNTGGLSLSFEDKGEGVVETEFMGHYELTAPDEVPFVIYYPKVVA